MTVKIALDAGHVFNTPGKRTPDGEREWSFNIKVLIACANRLAMYQKVEILRLDDATGKRDIPLKERTDKANRWGADVLVSIHHNAFQSKWGNHGGVETFTMDHPRANPKSVDIARIIQPRIVKAMGLRDRGVKKKNLHMLRESNMPAILTEGGFMDSLTDIGALRSDSKLKAQGEAIADGLAQYFKLKLKVVPTPPKKEETKITRLLNNTGREEAKQLITKAVESGLFQKSHLSKLDSYTDADLISYSIAYVNRTVKQGVKN